MKKQIRNCSLLLLMAAALGGCTQEEFAKDSAEKSKPITLMASVGSDAPQTRIGFEDKDANGIDLNWSKNDVFTVYSKSSGASVGNFRLISGEGTKHATFEAAGNLGAMLKGDYVAVYPASTAQQYSAINRTTCGLLENWNKMAQLSDMVHMEVEFAFDPDNITELAFQHKYAMLTIVLQASAAGADGTFAKVSMHNSGNNDFADIQLTNQNSPKAYTMMQPSAGERKLTFVVTTSTGKVYTQTIETDKAHIAGKRYTATLDGLTEATETVDLASFASSAPTSNVWIISDSGSPTEALFADLCNKLKELDSSERKIEIIFPNLTTIPNAAFYDTNGAKSLQSVSAPKATAIEDYAFYNCAYLASIYFPNVTSIGSDAFSSCGLVSCDFPNAVTIATNAFMSNIYLTSVNLPVATSIGDKAFNYSSSIRTMTIALNSFMQQCGNIFHKTDASNISLSTNGYNGTDVSADGKSWIVPAANGGTIEIGPFKEITRFK